MVNIPPLSIVIVHARAFGQISLSDTPYYHCIARCVRRAFLCGTDATTGKDYSHCKDWVTERLTLLASTFAIDVCAYAVLDNHLHTVLKINAQKAKSRTDNEVIHRWQQLFTLTGISGALSRRRMNALQRQSNSEHRKILQSTESA